MSKYKSTYNGRGANVACPICHSADLWQKKMQPNQLVCHNCGYHLTFQAYALEKYNETLPDLQSGIADYAC